MTKYSPHSKFLASICVVSVFAGGLAQAQDGPSDTEARLSTVTVTAQRIEENLQDVPISITAISDEKLNTLKNGRPVLQ